MTPLTKEMIAELVERLGNRRAVNASGQGTAFADPLCAEAATVITILTEEREWRPIETAPKDGTRILAWEGSPNAPEHAEAVIVRWETTGAEPFGTRPEWVTDSEGPGYQTGFADGELTHWKPLPEPPRSEG